MFLTRFFAATPDNPRFSLNDPQAWDTLFGGLPSSAGVRVTPQTALSYAPWWRGVNLVSAAVGKLPFYVYKNSPGGRAFDPSHPAWFLLRRKPNEFQTAFAFKQLLTAHALTQGNGYAYIDRDQAARPFALLPLDPNDVTPIRENGVLAYLLQIGTETRKVAATDIYHIKGLSGDGLVGYSVYDMARESIGLGLAARKYGAVFFRNNARPNIAIEVPRTLNETQMQDLKKGWESVQGGLENAHRTAILQGGAKLSTFTINARDAMLVETRQFEIREIALWIGVPPHKLGDASKASYGSLEEENQDHLDDGLDPWLVRHEEEAWDKMLTEEEKANETHEALFDRKQLVRANLTARGNYYKIATGGRAWLTPDEVRQEEDLEEMGGDAGELKDPSNNFGAPGDGSDDAPPATPAKPGKPSPKKPPGNDAVRAVVEDAARRMVRRIGHAARAAAKKPATFTAWLDGFRGEHLPTVAEAFEPSNRLAFGTQCSILPHRLCEQIHAELLDLSGECRAADLADRVDGRMLTLEQTIPAALAAAAVEADQ